MISTVSDSHGYVIAHVEWRQVGQSGIEMLGGQYVWLQNLWIHPDYRGQVVLKELIADVLYKAPEALWGYFTREKYNHRMSKLFKRSSVERVANVVLV